MSEFDNCLALVRKISADVRGVKALSLAALPAVLASGFIIAGWLL